MNATALNQTASGIPPAGIVIELSYTLLVTLGNLAFTLLFLVYQYGCINFYEFFKFYITGNLQPFESELLANKICITKDKWVYLGEVEPSLFLKTGKYIEFLENNQDEWARRTGAKAYLNNLSLRFITLGFTHRIRRRMRALHKYGMETKLIWWNKYNLFFQSRIICQGMVCAIAYIQVAIMNLKTEKRNKTSALISHLKLPTFEIECPDDLKDWVKHLLASTDLLHKEEKEMTEAYKDIPENLSPFLVPDVDLGSKAKARLKKKAKSGENSKTIRKSKSKKTSPRSRKVGVESNTVDGKSKKNKEFEQKAEICEQQNNILSSPSQ